MRSLQKKITHKNMTVLVTGGSEGIGKNLVEEIIREGAKNVIVMSRNVKKLQLLTDDVNKILKESNSLTQKLVTIPCDASKRIEVDKAFTQLKDMGINRIDFLYLVHGLSIPVKLIIFNLEIFCRTI